jgi:signal transduction histidine kinase/PAS domain-containing protein
MGLSNTLLHRLFYPSSSSFGDFKKRRIYFYRLLACVGSLLMLLHGRLHLISGPAETPLFRFFFSALLLLLVGSSYFSVLIRKHFIQLSWSILYLVQLWTAYLCYSSSFSAEYSLSFLLVYALFTGITLLGTRSVVPVLSFLAYGILTLALSIYLTQDFQTSPWVLVGGVIEVAGIFSLISTWTLSILESLTEKQRQLRESRNRYLQLLDQLPMEMAIFDSDSRFEFVNSLAVSDPERRDWVIGRTNEDYFDRFYDDPEKGRTRDDSIREIISTGTVDRVRETLQTEEGTKHYERVHVPIRNVDGEVTSVVGYAIDLTEQLKREATLAERQERIEALYEATSSLLRSSSQEEVAEGVYNVLSEVFGYPFVHVGFVEDGQINPHHTVSQPEYSCPEPEPCPVDETTVVGRALQQEQAVVVEDTDQLSNDINYCDLKSAAGVPIGSHGSLLVGTPDTGSFRSADLRLIEVLGRYAALVLDRLSRVQDLEKAKQEAEEAKAEAEAASAMKSSMLANMSHEIRTPLTSIIGFSEAIESEIKHLELPDATRDNGANGSNGRNGSNGVDVSGLHRFASLITQNGHRLLNTLDGILNLSKLQAGQMELEFQHVSLSSLASQMIEEFQMQADQKDIDLDIEVSESLSVWADRSGVQIILQNLISNAIKYTQEGGQVSVRVHYSGEWGAISVEDNGIGMEEEVINKIFRPFRQVSEGRNRSFEGTGIGLAVTRRATKEMNGTLEVESEKGEGSQFTIFLPTPSENKSESTS